MTINQKSVEIEIIEKKINTLLQKLYMYAQDKNQTIRYDAIEALPLECNNYDTILSALNDKNYMVRVAALDKICSMYHNGRIIEKVGNLLKDKNWLVKAYAIESLANNNAAKYHAEIKSMLKKSKNDELKIRIYYALIKFGEVSYIDKLFDFLNHDYYRVRIATSNTLYYLADINNINHIVYHLQLRLLIEEEHSVRSTLEGTIKDIEELGL